MRTGRPDRSIEIERGFSGQLYDIAQITVERNSYEINGFGPTVTCLIKNEILFTTGLVRRSRSD